MCVLDGCSRTIPGIRVSTAPPGTTCLCPAVDLLDVHVGAEQIVLRPDLVEARRQSVAGTEVELFWDSECQLGLGTAVMRPAQGGCGGGDIVVSERGQRRRARPRRRRWLGHHISGGEGWDGTGADFDFEIGIRVRMTRPSLLHFIRRPLFLVSFHH